MDSGAGFGRPLTQDLMTLSGGRRFRRGGNRRGRRSGVPWRLRLGALWLSGRDLWRLRFRCGDNGGWWRLWLNGDRAGWWRLRVAVKQRGPVNNRGQDPGEHGRPHESPQPIRWLRVRLPQARGDGVDGPATLRILHQAVAYDLGERAGAPNRRCG